ncbi:hypothetical protein ACP4OV_014842 [Aristida adscensionis]
MVRLSESSVVAEGIKDVIAGGITEPFMEDRRMPKTIPGVFFE